MKKILLLASVIVCLTACSSPLNKSVTELLTPEEVNQVNKKYDFFCNMYDGIEKTMKYSTTAEKAPFVALSYGRLCDWIVKRRYTDFSKDAEKEWEEKFGHYCFYERVDSMSNYWKEYAKVHGKSSYSIPYNIRELWKEEEQGNKKGDIMYEFYVEQIVKYEFGCKEYSELLEYRHNYEERVTKEWDELSYDFMKYYSKNWFK